MKFILDGCGRAINTALVQYFFVRAVPRTDADFSVAARFFYCLYNTGKTAFHDVDLAYFKTRDEARDFLAEIVDKLNAEETQ